ncbi:MAG: HPr family phosphocarrier protein [Thermoprotei archaeon]|nr:MAG: HPr family phosphocarrier protein [Thermoprotei archaeon]
MTVEASFKILNRLGLHARPAALFVKTCRKFKSKIVIFKGDRMADAKNILQVLALDVNQGDEIKVVIEGEDEKEAYMEIENLIKKVLPEVDRG